MITLLDVSIGPFIYVGGFFGLIVILILVITGVLAILFGTIALILVLRKKHRKGGKADVE